MNLISTIIGIVFLIVAIIGFFPLLGWINWIALIGSVIGIIFGAFARRKTGVNINFMVMLLAMFRLIIGGGLV